jgi:hypothetical protein
MRVKCKIVEVERDGDFGTTVPAVVATCDRCSHETESFGRSEASRRRCLVLMREECPEDESNYYVDSDA